VGRYIFLPLVLYWALAMCYLAASLLPPSQ
jgi:hypothetical protein